MNTTTFFQSLKDNLSEIDQITLVESTNRDKIIQNQISDPEFFQKCVDSFGKKIEKWSLGNIACLSLGLKTDILVKEVNDKSYLKTAISYLDENLKSQIKDLDFKKATYIALALFERKRKNQSWSGLIEELSNRNQRKNSISNWRTSLSILYSFLNHDDNFVLALLEHDDPYVGVSFVNHILSTQLLTNKEKASKIVNLLEKTPVEIQITWLQSIPAQVGFLVEDIAQAIGKSPSLNSASVENTEKSDPRNLIKFDSSYKLNLLKGFKYQIENSPVQAETNFRLAKNKIKNILKLIDLNTHNLSLDELNKDLSNYVNDPRFDDLAFNSSSDNLQKNSDNTSQGILTILSNAYLLQKKGEVLKAREIAARQFKNWLETHAGNWPSPESIAYLSNLDHKNIIGYLNLLGLNGLSAEYVIYLDSLSLSRSIFQDEFVEGLQTMNLFEEAYKELKISLLSDGNNSETYQKIFKLLEKANNWQSLFLEWKDYSKQFELSNEDWVQYAKAALNANHLDATREIIEKMSAVGVDQTQIDMINGKLFYIEGDFEKARIIFEETTKRVPTHEEGWLVLGNVYQEMGQFQKSMDTLKTGVLAIPDSATIHYKLAELCISQELFAEALPYIRKATSLNPDNSTYSRDLIHTLQSLGRNDEADEILNQARLKWTHDPELAYIDAVRQIEKQNRELALAAFDVAINANYSNIPSARLKLYVQTILADRPEKFLPTDGKYNSINNLLTSQKILNRLMDENSDEYHYLQLLLAEIYFLTGEYESANSLYTKILNEFKENDNYRSMLWRAYAGFGLVKLGLSEIDSGIAALQEADQLNPNHLGIKQKCAEAYLSAKLLNQAETKATEVYELGSTEIDNLLWYANFMHSMGKPEHEVRGLEQILHFDPANSIAITRLAGIYISNGKIEDAYEILVRLDNVDDLKETEIRSVVISFLRIGKKEEALTWFSKIKFTVSGIESKLHKFEEVYLLMLNNKWDKALSEIQVIKKMMSNNFLLSSLEGDCLFNLADFSASVNALETAIILPKENSDFSIQEVFQGSLIPESWLSTKTEEINIYSTISKAYIQLKEFERSLEVINRMVRIDPSNLWLYIWGAEYAMQLTDYDLASDYLLKLRTNVKDNDWQGTDVYATALNYTCAYLNGRDYKLKINEPENKSEIKLLLSAHNMIDNNLFEDAQKIYEEFNFSIIDESAEQEESSTKNYSEVKKSIWERVILLLSWRLYDYKNVAEILKYQSVDDEKLITVEQIYLRLAVNFTYKKIYHLLNKFDISEHRSEVIEVEINSMEKNKNLLSKISQFGKSRAIKNIEEIYQVVYENDFVSAISLLNSRTSPDYLNFILIDELMKANKVDDVEEYLKNYQTNLFDGLFYFNNQPNNSDQNFESFFNSQSSDDPIWLMFCSHLMEIDGNQNEAAEIAEQALRIWPDETLWMVRIAKLYQKLGNLEKAETYWMEVISRSIKPEEFIYQYADLLIENKKSIETLTILNEFRENIPDSYNLHLTKAKAFLLENSFEEVMKEIDLARKFKPKALELDVVEAETYLLGDKPEYAKEKIQEILNINPGYEKAHVLNAILLRKSDKYAEAVKMIDKSLVSCPESKQLLIEKVKSLRAMENYSDGLLITSELSQKFPKDIMILELLANLYYDIEDFEAAEMIARKSLHIDPNHSDIHILLGHLARRHGHLDQALDHFSKAVLNGKVNIDPWLEMGDIYLDQNEPEKALDAFREAYLRDENDPRAYYKSGLLLRDLKDYQGAEKMLRIASTLTPKNASIRRQLAGVVALNLVHSS